MRTTMQRTCFNKVRGQVILLGPVVYAKRLALTQHRKNQSLYVGTRLDYKTCTMGRQINSFDRKDFLLENESQAKQKKLCRLSRG